MAIPKICKHQGAKKMRTTPSGKKILTLCGRVLDVREIGDTRYKTYSVHWRDVDCVDCLKLRAVPES
jgi:hypothetical protein